MTHSSDCQSPELCEANAEKFHDQLRTEAALAKTKAMKHRGEICWTQFSNIRLRLHRNQKEFDSAFGTPLLTQAQKEFPQA